MLMLLNLIAWACGVASLVCFILVLIQMFQRDQTGLAIACIVLFFVCGIGMLVAFIMGWINAARWKIEKVMLAWTACVVVGILVQILNFVFAAGAAATGL